MSVSSIFKHLYCKRSTRARQSNKNLQPARTPCDSWGAECGFEGRLSEDNCWVKMAKLIPWSEFEEDYAENFPTEMGAPAKSFRMALGALIIKEKLGISDIETVEHIRENPYLQYFIGQSTYSNEPPFDPSLVVHFRQRISANLIKKVNEGMVNKIRETTPVPPEKKKDSEVKNESPN